MLSKQEIDRLLKSQVMAIRDQLREVGRQQESARKDLQTFRDEQKAPVDAANSGRLSRFQQDQERVTSGLSRTVKDFDLLLGKMEANKVGDEKEKAWLAGLRTDVDSLATKNSAEVGKMIEEVKSQAVQTPQKPETLDPILEKEQRIERDIQMLVTRLSEFGDLNAVINQLREIQKRQADIRQKTLDRAKKQGAGNPPEGEGEKATNGEGTR